MAGASTQAPRRVHWLQRAPPAGDIFQAAACGDQEWLRFSLKRAQSPSQPNKQGLTVLHVAAQHGRLECVKLLVESPCVDVNASCPRGRRPLHMALSLQSKPNSYACLTYLLQHGALHNVLTDEGLTPLHMAAAEGLRECVEILVEVGSDTHACDSRGHTPLDLARIWGHRVIVSTGFNIFRCESLREFCHTYIKRHLVSSHYQSLLVFKEHFVACPQFLKNAMWQRDKEKDMERRKALQNLRQDLIRMYRSAESTEKVAREAVNEQKVSEWAERKGLTLLKTPLRGSWTLSHGCCLSTEPLKTKTEKSPGKAWNISPNPSRPPPASLSRPQEVRMGIHPEEATPEADLQQSVTLGCFEDGRLHYTTSWDGVPEPVPALPMDVIKKGLFPSSFLSRITSPQQFQASTVLDLPHRGCAPQAGASPWTEVAMHLAEELELGHY